MENGGNIGHALLCVGHETVTTTMIDSLVAHEFKNLELKNAAATKRIKCYDYDHIDKKFIFVDDNMPAYQEASLDNPAIHYTSQWHSYDCWRHAIKRHNLL